MQNQDRTETILAFLIRIIPPLSIAVVVIGLVSMSILLKKPDILIRGQYLAFPIILACLILIYHKPKNLEQRETIKIHLSISSWNYHLIYFLLYLITIYLLIAYQTRPLAYFLLIASIAIIILAEILAQDYINKPTSVLFKIILLAANVIFGQTFKLPLYIGCTDILPHLHLIETILSKQHITASMGSYQYFPLYHIFNAIGQLLTNLDLQTAYFAFIGLSFLSSIYFIYLMTYKVTNSPSKSLVTALIYSLSSEALFAGMNMVTRVMSLVFFLVMFYLLISRRQGDVKKTILALFFIIPLVFTHQVTLVQEVVIIILFILLEFIIYYRNKLINLSFPFIFAISFIGYWIYIAGPFFDNIVKTVFSTTEAVVVSESTPDIPIYISFTSNLEFSIIAFFAIIGIALFLTKGLKQKERGRLGVLFALFSFLAMPLFLPGPAAFFNHILLTSRAPQMILPFMIVPTVEGIFYFLNRLKTNQQNIKRLVFVFFTVFTFVLTSTLLLGNSTDQNLNKLLANDSRRYFKQSELYCFDFCLNRTTKDSTIYTDHFAKRYLSSYAQANSSSSNKPLESLSDTIDGYLLLRTDLLKERNHLGFMIDKVGFMGIQKSYTSDDFNHSPISDYLKKRNKVFENNTGIIYNL